MRALGIDLGTVRIGLALSDSRGTMATPYKTLARSKDKAGQYRDIRQLVHDEEVDIVVVGMPLGLDGGMGRAALAAQAEADALASLLDVPVVTHDERLTTVTAHRQLQEAGVSNRRRRQVVDQQAAVVLLQAWLDANPPEEFLP